MTNVASVVRKIHVLTGNDTDLGSKAFEIWNKNQSLTPSKCVELAIDSRAKTKK